jgi:transposase
VVAVQVRYRYRIYPEPGQQEALAQVFGSARVVFNDCLRLRDACHAAGETISDAEVQRRFVTLAKRTPERAWLAKVASVALVQACQDARRAYRNWVDSLSGTCKGRRPGGREELLEDFVSLVAIFAGRLYCMRSAGGRRRLLVESGQCPKGGAG